MSTEYAGPTNAELAFRGRHTVDGLLRESVRSESGRKQLDHQFELQSVLFELQSRDQRQLDRRRWIDLQLQLWLPSTAGR